MCTVLTIDTSSAKCSVSLKLGGKLTERTSEAQRQSAQRVLPMIQELLSEAGIRLSDIELIAVVAGPGSFTGVRIGIAVAQGLCLTAELPVVALSSLALQAMLTLSDKQYSKVLVCEEAREEEVYFAAYQQSDALGVELIGKEQVALIPNLDPLPKELVSGSWCLAGNGWARTSEILQQLESEAVAEPCNVPLRNELIVELGVLRYKCGEAVAAAQLRPNYVKEHLVYT
ncbi:MAG: tRNA (adenosine(37)-N6)-threonylcarbamoyltransferase complex dimerization subunit type 1 TsaB [Gammaproteobacteria bacterium]|nr:tRNA (adenosine(37)-N6)-threonylcarbamoyltransferase complex dimerization subunit type 1 TsaB [Gammaproteobacteria bacterium]